MAGKRGFASMAEDQHNFISSKGGRAVSRNRAHMAAIGQRGGLESQALRRATDTLRKVALTGKRRRKARGER